MKHHELLWGSAIVAFIAWVLLAPNPTLRINRACRPLHWGSSGLVSLTALTAPKYEASVQNGGNRVVYGCEYSLWRLFYQKQYDAYLSAEHRLPGARSLQSCAKTVANDAKREVRSGGHAPLAACTPAHVIVSRPTQGSGS